MYMYTHMHMFSVDGVRVYTYLVLHCELVAICVLLLIGRSFDSTAPEIEGR